MTTITIDNIEEFIKNNDVVILDFWAPWCAPCKMLNPVMDEIYTDFPDVKIGKINIDEERELAYKFIIKSIPTIVFIKKGKVVDTLIGAVPKKIIEEKLDKIINN